MSNISAQFIRALLVDECLMEKLSEIPFSATGTRRLCLHESDASPLHAMLVESAAGNSFPVHYHSDSDEVIIVMKGSMEIIFWEKGLKNSPTRAPLGRGKDEVLAALMPKHTPHATKSLDTNCVYLELKLGPFIKDAMKTLGPVNLLDTKSNPGVADHTPT